jgi:glycogen operon protein
LRDIEWHGCALNGPGWDNMDSKLLAFTIGGMEEKDSDLHVMMNFDSTALGFEIPQLNDGQWTLTMDTSWLSHLYQAKLKYHKIITSLIHTVLLF